MTYNVSSGTLNSTIPYYTIPLITVLPSNSCGGTSQNLDLTLLHSSTQTSADHRSRRRHVSHMTDEKGETWSPFGMSKVMSRPESLGVSGGRLFHAALQPP